MNIAFWSNVLGKGATSGNMVAVATMSSVLYSLKTVLIQTDRMSKPIEEVFERKRNDNMINEEFHFYNKKGMDEILERGRLNLLTHEIIRTNMINVKHTNMYYIPSSREKVEPESDNDIKTYGLIMRQLNNMGELNFWDISNGDNSVSKVILSKSDVIVINLNQNSEGFNINDWEEGILEKAVFLVGRFDSDSRIGVSYICKGLGISQENIGIIPYNIHFYDAVNEGKIVPFIMKNIFSKKQDVNFEFINNVFRATNLVLRKAGIEGIGE